MLLIALLFLTGCLTNQTNQNMQTKEITINNVVIKIEIATTLEDQKQGLSDRESLNIDAGLLFVYDNYEVRNFWMKDMNFPLDILWIKDSSIVGFEQNIPIFNSQGQVNRIGSKVPVNRVLELNSGYIRKNGFKVGDQVEGLD